MNYYDLIIVGGGPMGIVTAIEAQKANLSCLILEEGCLVNSIYHFPDNMTFFSTSERLEIGDVPFMSLNDKPTRNEALEYYRRVVRYWQLTVHTYEKVTQITGQDNDLFLVESLKQQYEAKYIVVATGFYSKANKLQVPGEDLDKVTHYYSNAHPYINQKVVVVGAGNSACQVALDLYHKNIDVTMVVRAGAIKETVKYWIKPNIENRIKEGSIKAYFNAEVTEITNNKVHINQNNTRISLDNDYVLAMIGYQPDYAFLAQIGINNCDDEYLTPNFDSRQQSNIQNIYLAGVVCGGMKTNRFLIENSKAHADEIINDILKKEQRN